MDCRIQEHPILSISGKMKINFIWCDQVMQANEGETIASALFANGIRIFGYHHKSGAAQGIFCANGQCAQCSVIANGILVKACMTQIDHNMVIMPSKGKVALLDVNEESITVGDETDTVETECLIIGGGPSGLSAAVELAKKGVNVIIVDDKIKLGGKLILQTHKFFGSVEACYAGMRGMDIASKLAEEIKNYDNITIWSKSNALAIFSDKKIGIIKDGNYVFVKPKVLLVATGAREKSLVFSGNYLPGVYGAGAFQTLVNRDLIKPTKRLFVVGGGNVGLITAYHALQAGIKVVGLCEALSNCGGYKVHYDKLIRAGIPIYNSHTIISANGNNELESVTIAQIDTINKKPMLDTMKTFLCDTLLVAVGLDSVNEFLVKAKDFDLPVFSVGDAETISEASVAMFTGRIRGLEIVKYLGYDVDTIPDDWQLTASLLKERPRIPANNISVCNINDDIQVFPVFHCLQEIPCNPCTSVCPQNAIVTESGNMLGIPNFVGNQCIACERCVAICPGLAITLVDTRKQAIGEAIVTVPYEFAINDLSVGDLVNVVDMVGNIICNVPIVDIRSPKFANRTILIKIKVPIEIAKKVAGIQMKLESCTSDVLYDESISNDAIVCRCEHVTTDEIRESIRAGVRDMNELKGYNRCGMGACGGKTCSNLIMRIFVEEGVSPVEVKNFTNRPLFMETSMGILAGKVSSDFNGGDICNNVDTSLKVEA